MIINYFYKSDYGKFLPESRETCKHYCHNKFKKCDKYYKTISSMKENMISQCPYGYSSINYNNVVLTSMVTNKSDSKKIKRRIKYCEYNEDIELIDIEKSIYSLNYFANLIGLYNDNKPLIHDLGNAINYLLNIINFADKQICNIDELRKYYLNISSNISLLRDYSQYVVLYNTEINYETLVSDYIITLRLLQNTAKDYCKIAENYKDIYILDEDKDDSNRSFFEGFSLIRTLIEYNEKIINVNNINKTSILLKPHKMMKKLSRLLAYKADKNNIKIIFIKQQDVEIYNTPDLYIVFFTLLDNAIKYCIPNSSVIISFDYVNGINIIEISNPFEGFFEANDIESIGTRGFKGKNSNNGNGLGLYLVNEIISISSSKIEYNPSGNIWKVKISLFSF
jgi:signal transduction histidine kinase